MASTALAVPYDDTESDAVEPAAATEPAAPPPPPPPDKPEADKSLSVTDYLKHIIGVTLRSIGRQEASTPKAIATGAAELNRLTGIEPTIGSGDPTDPKQRYLYKLGQGIEDTVDYLSPNENPALKDSFWATTAPDAVGSGIGFILGGGIGKIGTNLMRKGILSAATRKAEIEALEAAAEKGAPLALKLAGVASEGAEVAALGATSQFQSAYEDALKAGADRNHALAAGLWNLPIGASEIVPLGKMLDRLDKFSGGTFSKYLVTATKETFEEAMQEAVQGLASNIVEKNLYNPAKDLLSDLAPQAAAGGVAGFLLSSLTHAIGGGVGKARDVAMQSRLRRERNSVDDQGLADAIARRKRINEQVQEPTAGGIPAEQEQPPVTSPEVEAPEGTPLGSSPSEVGSVTPETVTQINAPRSNVPIPIQIQQADGTTINGEFNGYYDLRDMGRGVVPSIGKVLPDGKMTHTLLDVAKGEKIVGDIPTFEEWESGTRQNAGPQFPVRHLESPALRLLVSSNKATVKDVLSNIKDANADELSLFAQHLLNVADPESLNVRVVLDPSAPTSYYDTVKDIIGMSPRNSRPGYHLIIPLEIYLHEAIHAMTSVKMNPILANWGPGVHGDHYVRHLYAAAMGPGVFNPHLKELGKLYLTAVDHYSRTVKRIDSVVGDADAVKREGAFYGLGNLHEFMAEAFSNRDFQKWLDTIPTYKARNQTVWGQVVDFIRKLLGFKQSDTSYLQRVLEATAGIAENPRGKNGFYLGKHYAPTEPVIPGHGPLNPKVPVFPSANPKPELETAQVQGGSAEVGRIANEVYAQREAAARELEGLAYQRKQFRDASSKLKELSDIATGRLTQAGFVPNEENGGFPDPKDGVSIVEGVVTADDTFVNKLASVKVAHDPENVKSMQEAIFLEGAARRYGTIMDRVGTLMDVQDIYEKSGVKEEVIADLKAKIDRLLLKAERLGGATHGEESVSARYQEILHAESERVDRMGQRDSLSLEPVQEFFGPQIGSYRKFAARVKEAQDLATRLVNLTSPDDHAALAKAMKGMEDWLRIPDDIREGIRLGKPLSDEQRASIFAALGQVFEDFDAASIRMQEKSDNRLPRIEQEIRTQMEKLADAKISKGTAEVLLADVFSTMSGETGYTGTLQDQAMADELKNRVSAITAFAQNVGENIETNKDLYDWLTDPSEHPFTPATGASYGVSTASLEMILREVKLSPAFGSAILTLIDSARGKLDQMPTEKLRQIEDLIKTKSPEDLQKATAIAAKLLQQSKSNSSLAAAAMRDALRSIDALQIEASSIAHGREMFRTVADAPDFKLTRHALDNSPYGMVEPMVAQNNTEVTFKPFGIPGLPSHPGFVMNAAADPSFKSRWYRKTVEWHAAAQHYIDAYTVAEMHYDNDRINNPSPASLGFDLPKVRGLKDATRRFVPGSFLELSLLSDNKRWRVNWLNRQLSRTAWFRQHGMVSRMVGGVQGTDLRGRLADFSNHFLIAQAIREKYQDIPDLTHKALRSHPELKMNLADYREFWNEMAHYGRQFPSPVRPGFVLPSSGRVVTEQDFKLLKKQIAYEEELRRRVTESNPTQGIRISSNGRTLVRPGAYVGDYGLPRHLNRHADSFIADVIAAYGSPVAGFDSSTNLGPSSSSLVVQFWNRNTRMLVDHVLDSRRQDRTMLLNHGMQAAEAAVAEAWTTHGRPPITSLDDLVTILTAAHPPTPGQVTRDVVIKGLNDELRQYRNAAQQTATERAEREQSRQSKPSIAFSAENEFTRPAAKTALPSSLYDYGALTKGEHLVVASRANHERVLAYATALNRAITDLQDRITRYDKKDITEKEAAGVYGGDIEHLRDVLEVLRRVASDFEAAYANGNPSQGQSKWFREGFGLVTSAVLALPVVGLRNMTQGQSEVYNMARAMGMSGHTMTIMKALAAMPKTVAQFALTLGAGAARRADHLSAFITGSGAEPFSKLVDVFAKMLFRPNFRDLNTRVHELGFDTREGFLDRMGRIWQETAEFESRADHKSFTVGGRRVARVAAAPTKIIKAFFDKIGVQQYDLAINSAALTYTSQLERRMQEVAKVYGAERERMGLTQFDPGNPDFQLRASEWAAMPTEQSREDALAFIRSFFEGSANPEGFQLERNLWEFYQKNKAGDLSAKVFSDRQFDAIQRKWLADVNASTPVNRSSAASGQTSAASVVRNMMTLQGYATDALMKMLDVAVGGVNDRGMMAQALGKLPTQALMALMAVLIGYGAGALTGLWDKIFKGRMGAMPNPLDKDFWATFQRWKEGTFALGMSQLYYIGDLVLAMRGEIVGNRGFDPVGKVVPISMVQRFLGALRGVYNQFKNPLTSLGERLTPLADLGRSMVPYWAEAEHLFGRINQTGAQAIRLLRGEAQVNDLLEGRSGFQGQTYGPTTVIRRNLLEDVSEWYEALDRKDPKAAAAAIENAKAEVNKLIQYHYQKYLKSGLDEQTAMQKAEKDAWNDYQDINPAVAAMLGKRPTDAQLELMLKGMSGDRLAAAKRGLAAWQAGAQELFGREGVTTREQMAENRAGGGSAGGLTRGLRPRAAVSRRGFSLRTPGLASGGGGGGGGSVAARPRTIARQVTRRVSDAVGHAGQTVRNAVRSGASRVRRLSTSVRRAAAAPRVSKGRRRNPSFGSSRRRRTFATA